MEWPMRRTPSHRAASRRTQDMGSATHWQLGKIISFGKMFRGNRGRLYALEAIAAAR